MKGMVQNWPYGADDCYDHIGFYLNKQGKLKLGNFEQTAAELAIEQGYDYVICGHIHQPQKRMVTNEHGSVMYLNSGDWIENLTALEYVNGDWNVYGC